MKFVITKETIQSTLNAMLNHNNFDSRICRLEIIDVRIINNLWKPTRDYIGKFDNIIYPSAKEKFLNSKRDIIEGKVTVPPYIYVDNNGNIDFYNGRNRFANLRDAGAIDIPCVIEKVDYKKLLRLIKNIQ